jgi:hypothetical protein
MDTLKFLLAGVGILMVIGLISVVSDAIGPQPESRGPEIARLLRDVSGALRAEDGATACARMTERLQSSIVQAEAGSEPASSCVLVVDQYGPSIARQLPFDPPKAQELVMRLGCIDWAGRDGKKLNVRLNTGGLLVYGGPGTCPKAAD